MGKRVYCERTAVVSRRGASRVRSGHPWVYRSDILEAAGEPGDIVRVADRRGRFLGRAFYNPRSEISLRVATRSDVPVDEGWFYSRMARAAAYRDSLSMDADAYRLLHAEADGVPGLVVDRYGPYLVVQAGSAAVERRLEWVAKALQKLCAPEGILARGDFAARRLEGLPRRVEVLSGAVPDSVTVRQSGVLFRVSLRKGQKTGLFLDQRENHRVAGSLARGRMLDVFSYAGGFGLHAARRADSVELVDSSEPALRAARENARLNGLENVSFTRANAFDLLRERAAAGEGYDMIALDPPAFARERRDLDAALRAYKEINLRAMKLLRSGGLLFSCSCSYHVREWDFKQILRDAAADAGRRVRLREWRGQAPDHPEILTIPETRYLKCAALEIL